MHFLFVTQHVLLRVLCGATSGHLHAWITLLGGLAENQAFQDASDRIKLYGIDKRIGADVEK